MKTKSITKVTLLSIVVLSAITAVTLNSCQKESIKPKATTSKNQSSGNLEARYALAMSEANNFLFATHKNQKGLIPGGTDSNSCVIITSDTIDKPNTLTYNYGSNCIGDDQKVRSGIVTITYADKDIRLANNYVSINFQGYTVNGQSFNGGLNVTNTGPNGLGNDVLVETGSFYSQAQNQISPDTMKANYQYEWIAGESSSPAANWQFSVTGGWVSSYIAGQSDSLVITSPLIQNAKNTGCNFKVGGTQYTVTTTLQGLKYKYEDFSNPGGCTGQVSVTQNGVTDIESQ